MISPRLKLARAHAPDRLGLLQPIGGATLLVLGVSLVAALLAANSGLNQIVLIFGINAIMVVGYQTFAGNTGIVSFGHVAFMAIGAYAGGIAAIPASEKQLLFPDMPGILSSWSAGGILPLLIGGLAAAVVGLVAGLPLMRLTGSGASIATLGLLIIVNNLISQATPITRGPQAFFGVPANTTFVMVFGSLIAVVLLSAYFKWSTIGRAARAGRDQATAAAAAGVSVVRSRVFAFVLSAFITGVAGALYAQLLTAFSPGSFYVPQIVLIVAMAIVGGINSISGALLGAALVTALNELMRRLEDGVSIAGQAINLPTGIAVAVMGLALVLTLLKRPDGLMGHNEVTLGR